MAANTLESFMREGMGKKFTVKQRSKGFIPAVLYGHKGNKNLSVKAADFEALFDVIGEHSIITLNVDNGEKAEVIVKDFQLDPVKRSIIHVDFFEVERGKTLKTAIPVKIEGVSLGVKKGGVLELFLRDIEIECLPKDIPDHILIDIGNLDIGDSMHVKDLNMAENLRVISNPEQVVVLVGHPTKVAAPVAAPEEVPVEGEAPTEEAKPE
jgi:large subunit ribosomal protein L25